jgi:hypothetical protein
MPAEISPEVASWAPDELYAVNTYWTLCPSGSWPLACNSGVSDVAL